VPVGGTSRVTFTISHPSTTHALGGVAFSDTFPAGLQVAPTPNVSDTCGFSGDPVAGATSFSLTGGSIAAGGACTLAVDVVATLTGTLENTTSGVNSNEAPASAASNTSALAVGVPAGIPAVSELGLLVAALLLAAFGVRQLLRA
jgi:hypothetical protein